MKPFGSRLQNVALAGVLGAFTATLALATPAMPGFKTADSNGDGLVSLEEFAAQGGQGQAFLEADANHDSRLNGDEYTKASANNDRSKASKYVDDAWITAKIKTLLLKDEGLKGLDVSVETYQGAVLLSGSVNTPVQIAQAEKIARGIDGVRAVSNELQLKR